MGEGKDSKCSQSIVGGNRRARDCRRECKESDFVEEG